VDVRRAGDQGVGDLDAMRAAETPPVVPRLAAHSLVDRHAVQHPKHITDDELLARTQAGIDLGDGHGRTGEKVAPRVPFLQPRDDRIVAPQPFNDHVGVEKILSHERRPAIVPGAATASTAERTRRHHARRAGPPTRPPADR